MKRKKSTYFSSNHAWGVRTLIVDGTMLLLVPCAIYSIVDSIFIVAECHTERVPNSQFCYYRSIMALPPPQCMNLRCIISSLPQCDPMHNMLALHYKKSGVDYEMVTVNSKTSRTTFLSFFFFTVKPDSWW
jgi:hypothetical protein